jgi:hypothetical protein
VVLSGVTVKGYCLLGCITDPGIVKEQFTSISKVEE